LITPELDQLDHEDQSLQAIEELAITPCSIAKAAHDTPYSMSWFLNLCVPSIDELKKLILKEAHDTPYSIHPGGTKMYQNLKEQFWWHGMKWEIAFYIARCDVCQRVKAEHQRPMGLLQPLKVPMWKWEEVGQKLLIPDSLTGRTSKMEFVCKCYGQLKFADKNFPKQRDRGGVPGLAPTSPPFFY
jgi:hypothetical protein